MGKVPKKKRKLIPCMAGYLLLIACIGLTFQLHDTSRVLQSSAVIDEFSLLHLKQASHGGANAPAKHGSAKPVGSAPSAPSATARNDGAVDALSPGKVDDQPPRRWAYAFLLSGIDPAKLHEFQGFLANIVIAAHILRTSGSVADIILMVQLSKFTNATRLEPEQERVLATSGVNIHYLPPPIRQSFYAAQMEKFRILQFTNYTRILYMDSDVLPFCNLDYIFQLSDPEDPSSSKAPLLKENMVLTTDTEPSNGGFFLLTPRPGDFEDLQQIIARREAEALSLPHPYFDETIGFGHKIERPDYVRNLHGPEYHTWKWHGAFADQGLLYYWTKYWKQDVSIVNGGKVEHWGKAAAPASSTDRRSPRLESTDSGHELLRGRSCLPEGADGQYRWGNNKKQFHDLAPYRDFRHFTGKTKPFEWKSPTKDGGRMYCSTRDSCDSAGAFWWMMLRRLVEEDGLHSVFDLSNWSLSGRAPLGGHPTYRSLEKMAKARQRLATKAMAQANSKDRLSMN